MADALDSMADHQDEHHEAPPNPAAHVMLSVSTRAHAFLESIPQVEIYFTTSLMMGDRTVEIPWRYSRLERPTRLEPIVLPDHRIPADYATASCKHESAVLKQSRMCVMHTRYGRRAH